jgi:hypothetical protein
VGPVTPVGPVAPVGPDKLKLIITFGSITEKLLVVGGETLITSIL